MEIKEKKVGSAIVLSLEGRLDQLGAPRLNAPLSAGNLFIVVDLEGVDYVASSGISVLLRLAKRAREKGGDVVLARLQPQISAVVKSMRLEKVFDVYNDVASAAVAVVEGPHKPPPESGDRDRDQDKEQE